LEVFVAFNFELGKRYIQAFWVFLFSFSFLANIITSVIEFSQNAKGISNNWKTLLIVGILRDFLPRIWEDE
jgi:hypothetical protein